MKYDAYDYNMQTWITGEPARLLLIQQFTDEIHLIESPEGDSFLRMTNGPSKPIALAQLRRQLAELSR